METIAGITALSIHAGFCLIHIAVILKWLPYSWVWGGRIQSVQAMYRFEIPALLLSGLFLWVTLERLAYVTGFLSPGSTIIVFWIQTAFFSLNTIGNLLSKNHVERLVFTPIALLLALCCLVLSL